MQEYDLPDLNVWLALSLQSHPHHALARAYWQTVAPRRVAFCQITVHGFLRQLGNPHVATDAPATVGEAWAALKRLRALPEVSYAAETSATQPIIEEWIAAALFTPRMWTDVQLAALAKAHDYRLVTLDRDFLRFPGLRLLLLEPKVSRES
jgi:toxin-antitoxin system PIN domain toxin